MPYSAKSPPHLIDKGRACGHQPLAHPVERLDILLRDVFYWHKAHARTRHGFGDGFRIAHVIFVRFHIRLDILGRHQPDVMPLLAQLPGPIMCPAARFHPDGYPRQLGHKRHDLAAI